MQYHLKQAPPFESQPHKVRANLPVHAYASQDVVAQVDACNGYDGKVGLAGVGRPWGVCRHAHGNDRWRASARYGHDGGGHL